MVQLSWLIFVSFSCSCPLVLVHFLRIELFPLILLGLLLFQEFEFEVVFKLGKLNVSPDHLSQIDTGEEPTGVEDELADAHVFQTEAFPTDLEEYGEAPEGMSTKKKQILAMKATPYNLINGFLYKMGLDDILRICILEHERNNIMYEAHYGMEG